MEACHLLGHPWQFDCNPSWIGRSNIYYVLDNRKFNLFPQPWDAGISPSACLTVAKIEHELEDTDYCYAVVAQALPMTSFEDPFITLDGTFLRSYEFLPTGASTQSPPAMLVQHQINLVLGASIPNHPHYWMPLDQHEEL